jgi:hypothetical protein
MLPQGSSEYPDSKKTRSQAAAAAGISPRTYDKARAVVEAAVDDPKKFGPIMEAAAATRRRPGCRSGRRRVRAGSGAGG